MVLVDATLGDEDSVVKDFTVTDHTLQTQPVVRLVGYTWPFNVFKVCKQFGPSRFNLTLSNFHDYQANTAAQIFFFEANILKSRSTVVLSDTNYATVYADGNSAKYACIEKDTTTDICMDYYTDSYYTPTFIRKPVLVVNNRVQAVHRDMKCNEYDDNSEEGVFYKIGYYRDDVLGIPNIVIDNP
ncbi:uncharacterized protein LOC132192433 [Neocloeon triangulifer]|uniref:uncharacterized protein LOC132192433 n=1 Tax=Neocloeon triangulifer TaxID=2078957 RepID=UPI00286F22A7|nr:uncharacterized protein LOC132192433 [Neocloeon triangulifer]